MKRSVPGHIIVPSGPRRASREGQESQAAASATNDAENQLGSESKQCPENDTCQNPATAIAFFEPLEVFLESLGQMCQTLCGFSHFETILTLFHAEHIEISANAIDSFGEHFQIGSELRNLLRGRRPPCTSSSSASASFSQRSELWASQFESTESQIPRTQRRNRSGWSISASQAWPVRDPVIGESESASVKPGVALPSEARRSSREADVRLARRPARRRDRGLSVPCVHAFQDRSRIPRIPPASTSLSIFA